MSRAAEEIGALDAIAQADLVARGEVTPTELVEWAIERIDAVNPVLNAVVTTAYEQARDEASRVSGPFAGVPMLWKDLLVEVPGLQFCEGSRFLRGNVSAFESEIAVRARRGGLVALGKTNTPEFGMAPACEPLLFGPTRNPWDPDRSTSGSSGGSAAAVAAGLVPIAHANDVGGSIRYPASACGLFGLKPTRARVPLGPAYGDAIGGAAVEHVVTRTVRDSAAFLDLTAGPSLGDPYWAPPPTRPFVQEVGADPGRLRIAFSPRTPEGTDGHPDCLKALEEAVILLEELGHEVTEVGFCGITPRVASALGTWMTAGVAWIVEYWIRHLGRQPGPNDLEPGTRVLWEAGQRVSAGAYLQAIEDLQVFGRSVARFLEDVDCWLTPTLSTPPARIGELVPDPADPGPAMHRAGETVRYAGVIANITGNPAMSVPLSTNADGLPIGVHFLGCFGDEAGLLRLAGQLEQAHPWALRWPSVNAVGR